jgi:predicted MFS family arabinose efflux permease
LGVLGAAGAAGAVAALLLGGILGTYVGWRPAFGILIVMSAVVFLLSFRLRPDKGRPDVKIDVAGVVLAAAAILLISFGFNNLNHWGLGLAKPGVPFSLLGLSPAPLMIVVGVVFGQAFLMWTRRRQAGGKTPLLPLEVIDSPQERAAVYAMFSVVALEAALNFSVPLYIQIVQGRSPLATVVAMLPFNLTVFFAAMLVVRFYDRLTPRQIGRYGFALCTIALLWLAFVVRNDWSAVPVLIGLVLFGIGQGSLVTLLFNVLVTASPKEIAGDVGSLRGTANNLAAAVGTAVAGALLVSLLSAAVLRSIADNPTLPPEIQQQVNLDNITFVSNAHLEDVLAGTTANRQQIVEAVRVNTEARLRALKIGLLIMAGLALVTIIPAGRLPAYRPGELPAADEPSPSKATS